MASERMRVVESCCIVGVRVLCHPRVHSQRQSLYFIN